MILSNVKTTMTRLLELQSILDFSQEEFKDEEVALFEEWMFLHEEILRVFNLPITQVNLKVFEKLKSNNFDSIIEELEQKREDHLLSSPVSFQDLMMQGIRDPSISDEIIGEMGLKNHCYVDFVYNSVWRAGNCKVEDAILELLLTKEHPESLNELGVLFFSKKLNEENERVLKLKELGYQFIDKYLQYLRCVVRGEGVLINKKIKV